jgi:ribosomal protein S18 acetylase RimI-like enzyme
MGHIMSSGDKSITTRQATTADLPRIGRLGALLVEEYNNFDSQRFIAPRNRTPADYASFMAKQIQKPDVVVLVADDHGDVIGYSYATVESYDYMSLRGPAGVLQEIIVDPEYRGRGAGRLLLDATLAELEARGAPRVVLTTAERDEAAQHLFDRVGFRRTMIEMTRELDAKPPA